MSNSYNNVKPDNTELTTARLIDVIDRGKSGLGFSGKDVNETAHLIKDLYDSEKGHVALELIAAAAKMRGNERLNTFPQGTLQALQKAGLKDDAFIQAAHFYLNPASEPGADSHLYPFKLFNKTKGRDQVKKEIETSLSNAFSLKGPRTAMSGNFILGKIAKPLVDMFETKAHGKLAKVTLDLPEGVEFKHGFWNDPKFRADIGAKPVEDGPQAEAPVVSQG